MTVPRNPLRKRQNKRGVVTPLFCCLLLFRNHAEVTAPPAERRILPRCLARRRPVCYNEKNIMDGKEEQAVGDGYFLLTNLLSEDEKRVITSITAHIERGEKRVGIQQIANENFLSTTTIVKMCKRLGFEGYSELYYYLSRQLNGRDERRKQRHHAGEGHAESREPCGDEAPHLLFFKQEWDRLLHEKAQAKTHQAAEDADEQRFDEK